MKLTKPAMVMLVVGTPIAAVVGFLVARDAPTLGMVAFLALIGGIVYILAKNKSGARVDDATREAALRMEAPPGLARLYILRRGFMGGQQGLNVAVDDGHEGQMRTDHFMVADMEPGPHIVAMRMNIQGPKSASEHPVTLNAGEVRLLVVTLRSGMVRMVPEVEEVTSPREARERIGTARMIDWLRRPVAGRAATTA